mgnify:CR=1 FL=1
MRQHKNRLRQKRRFPRAHPSPKRMTWQRRGKYFYWRFMRLQGSPSAIARGLAVGSFAGMFPIFGFQILLGVGLAAWIRGNKLTAAAATWISNPLTYLPLFAFNFRVGQWLLQAQAFQFTQFQKLNWQTVASLGPGFLITWFAGCFVMGCVAGIVSYIFGLWLIVRLRRNNTTPRGKS